MKNQLSSPSSAPEHPQKGKMAVGSKEIKPIGRILELFEVLWEETPKKSKLKHVEAVKKSMSNNSKLME